MRLARQAVLVAACCPVLALAACGSSSSDSAGGTATAASGASTKSSSTAAAVDIGLKYSGGKAGAADASAKPFVIGFVNQHGGSPSFPELEHAADAAVKFVNEKLGGVQGHPVKLDKCVIQAEEDGQKCAAQFLANPDIKIANMSLSVFGNGPFYKTIAGKFPTIVSVAGVADDYSSPHVYELDGGGDSVLATMGTDTKKLGIKKLAIISSNNPAGKFITGKVLIPNLKKLGVSPKAVYISDTATTPDYVSALQSSGAATADGVMLVPVAPTGCLSLYDAMKQLGIKKPVVTDFWCYNDPIPERTGGGPAGWQITSLAANPLIDTPEAAAFSSVMKAYGESKWINVGSTPKTFGDILTITKWANTVGFDKVTGPALEEQIKGFTGPAFMVPGSIACGHHPTYVGICGDSADGSTFKDGKWVSTGATKTATLKP